MPTLRRTAIAVAVLLLGAPAAVARAQSASGSALPFHAGQWGVSANITGGGNAGIGALRFTAPHRALVLDAGVNLSRATVRFPNVLGGDIEQHQTTTFATLDLGLRGYRPLSSTVSIFHTFGVNGSYQQLSGGGPHGWGAGVFGDLGGQFMLDPRFSLGVATGLRVTYNEMRSTSGLGTSRSTSVGLSTTPARLIGAVYF